MAEYRREIAPEGRWIAQGLAAGDGGWRTRTAGEPCLDELLDDPVMALLWRRDRIEPKAARATVLALRALVQSRTPAGAVPCWVWSVGCLDASRGRLSALLGHVERWTDCQRTDSAFRPK